MGFEHQINFRWTDKHLEEMLELLKNHKHFYNTVQSADKRIFEFKKGENVMPDFSIIIEKDGLYIINNLHSRPKDDIEFILEYLAKNKLDYHIIEL